MHLAAALLSAVVAASEMRAEAGIRTAGLTRNFVQGGHVSPTVTSLEASPRAALSIDAWDLRFLASYAPTLRVADLGQLSRNEIVHQASVAASTHLRAPWKVSGSFAITDGLIDPLRDVPRTTAESTTPTVLTLQPIRFRSLSAGLTTTLNVDRRSRVGAGVDAFEGGGVGAEAQRTMPTQQGVSGQAAWTYDFTRRDVGGVGIAASLVRTGSSSEAYLVRGSSTWRHRLTRLTEGWGGVGLATSFERTDQVESRGALMPVVELGASHLDARLRAEGQVVARTSLAVDRLTGKVVELGELQVRGSWQPAERWSLAATASGAAPWRGTSAPSAAVDLRAGWAAHRRVLVEVGTGGRWQGDEQAGVPSFLEVRTFVAVRVEGPVP